VTAQWYVKARGCAAAVETTASVAESPVLLVEPPRNVGQVSVVGAHIVAVL
jgi:hypothetical protein